MPKAITKDLNGGYMLVVKHLLQSGITEDELCPMAKYFSSTQEMSDYIITPFIVTTW